MDAKVTKLFFDTDRVMQAVDAKNRRALSRVGAFIQRRSRSSLRRRKKTSPAGKPPSVHSNAKFETLKNILFVYEPKTQSVVVGPVRTNERNATAVPNLHEFGGSTVIRRRGTRNRPATVRRVRYPARPFMGPAFDKELQEGTIPRAWAGPLGSVSAGP